MIDTRAQCGRPGGVTVSQVWPPFLVTETSPSSDPAQMTPFSTGDSAMVNTVARYSTLVWSLVMGPPEGPNVIGSWRVRSGLIGAQLPPSSVDLNTTLDPM